MDNPRSGRVMQAVGMSYRYTDQEQGQPKNFPVFFRMYRLNFAGNESWACKEYWNRYENHFIEEL